jgi:hypothetical protein
VGILHNFSHILNSAQMRKECGGSPQHFLFPVTVSIPPTIMSLLSVSVAAALLRPLCQNVIRDPALASVSPCKVSLSTEQDICLVADAVVSFLPTSARSGQVYALSIAANSTAIYVNIRANDVAHLRLRQSDSVVIVASRIWDLTARISRPNSSLNDSQKKQDQKRICAEAMRELCGYTLGLHIHKMRHHFNKRHDICEAFFALAAEHKPEIAGSASKCIMAARDISDLTSAFLKEDPTAADFPSTLAAKYISSSFGFSTVFNQTRESLSRSPILMLSDTQKKAAIVARGSECE